MGGDYARILFEGSTIIIKASNTVVTKARFGDGRSRNTLAHEIDRRNARTSDLVAPDRWEYHANVD
jgi:hypothetical protein